MSAAVSTDAQPTPEEKAQYQEAKRSLMQALSRRRALDKQLAALESQIYTIEGSYLVDTSAHSGGNIVHGFDGYLKNQVTKKRYELSDVDRLFSTSSITYQKSLELMNEGDESTATADEYRQPLSSQGLTTVVLPPASRAPDLTSAQLKKNRDREYQRKKRAAASRRSVGTVSDDEGSVVSSSRRPTKRQRLADD